jgi:hypothetical protein
MTMRAKHAAVIAAAAVLTAGASVVYAGGGIGADGLLGAEPDAGAVSGTCAVTKQSFATHVDLNSTTSTTYIDVPGASVPIKVSNRAGCITVQFSSMVQSMGNELLFVKAVLMPGEIASEPGQMQFESASPLRILTRSATFVFPDVPAGEYTVKMQYRSRSGGTVWVHRGVTVVSYA